MNWKPIDTAPTDEDILLGKWVEDDKRWFWIATGQVLDDETYWIDFTDCQHPNGYYHQATHWAPFPGPLE